MQVTDGWSTERYDPSRYGTSQFESGNETLDRWLVRDSGQSERRDPARTLVITDADAVIGYYALLAGELDPDETTEPTRKGISRHCPILVVTLAWLAVDRRHQKRGVGATPLRDALPRVVLASENSPSAPSSSTSSMSTPPTSTSTSALAR